MLTRFLGFLLVLSFIGCTDLPMSPQDDPNYVPPAENTILYKATSCGCHYGISVGDAYLGQYGGITLPVTYIGDNSLEYGFTIVLKAKYLSGLEKLFTDWVSGVEHKGSVGEANFYQTGSEVPASIEIVSAYDDIGEYFNITLGTPLVIPLVGIPPSQTGTTEQYLPDILTTGEAGFQNSAYGLTVESAKIDTSYPSSLTVTIKNIGVKELYNVSLTVQATSSNGVSFLESASIYLNSGETKDVNIGSYTGGWNSCNGCVLDKVSVVSMSFPSGTPTVSVSPYIPVSNITRY